MLLEGSSEFGLRSKRALLVLELSVMLDNKVNLEDAIECAYDEVEDVQM